MLKTSYEKEQRTLKQCKSRINEIWDQAQAVRSAIRMASMEVDKITEIKKTVDEQTAKADSLKEEEKEKLKKIEGLKAEIHEAEQKAAEDNELEEET